MFRRMNPREEARQHVGCRFLPRNHVPSFGGGWSGEPSVSRVDDDIDVGKNLRSTCGDKPVVLRLMIG
jgi:hypothetical protein